MKFSIPHMLGLTLIFCLFSHSSAFASEIYNFEVKDCISAFIDIEVLNDLNKQAAEVFPYTYYESANSPLTTLAPDDFIKRYAQATESSDFKKKYAKLVNSTSSFLQSGGVMLNKLPADDMAVSCRFPLPGTFAASDKTIPYVSSLSPVLIDIILKLSIRDAAYFAKLDPSKLGTLVRYWLTPTNTWLNTNKEIQAADKKFALCAYSSLRINESTTSDTPSPEECNQIDQTQLTFYREFFASTILANLFLRSYVQHKEQQVFTAGIYADFIDDSAKIKRNNYVGALGGMPRFLFAVNYSSLFWYVSRHPQQ